MPPPRRSTGTVLDEKHLRYYIDANPYNKDQPFYPQFEELCYHCVGEDIEAILHYQSFESYIRGNEAIYIAAFEYIKRVGQDINDDQALIVTRITCGKEQLPLSERDLREYKRNFTQLRQDRATYPVLSEFDPSSDAYKLNHVMTPELWESNTKMFFKRLLVWISPTRGENNTAGMADVLALISKRGWRADVVQALIIILTEASSEASEIQLIKLWNQFCLLPFHFGNRLLATTNRCH